MKLLFFLFPFINSWLWRTAGRGGFPNSLWLRRFVFPYIVAVMSDTIIAPIVLLTAACLPIPRSGHNLHTKLYILTFLVGAVYGLGVALLFESWLFSILSCLIITALFGIGVIACDWSLKESADDIWDEWEKLFGFVLGIWVMLGSF